jgi:hypothetical protein
VGYKNSVLYFKSLENLQKIKRTNGVIPTVSIDNKNSIGSSSVEVAVGKNNPKFGVNIVKRTTTTRPILGQLQRSNSVKRIILRPRLTNFGV